MITEHELTAALDQIRANLSVIDIGESRRAHAAIEKARERIDRTEADARARVDELRPTVTEIERVGAEKFDERSGSSAFNALLRGELDQRSTGAELLREYRNLVTALSGAASAREAQSSAQYQQRETDRAEIARAMAPLDELADIAAERLIEAFRDAYALIRAAKALARTGAPDHLAEAATTLRRQLGEVLAPPEIAEALEEFRELFALANFAVPTVIGIASPTPDYGSIHAAAARISAADRAAEREAAVREAAVREAAQTAAN